VTNLPPETIPLIWPWLGYGGKPLPETQKLTHGEPFWTPEPIRGFRRLERFRAERLAYYTPAAKHHPVGSMPHRGGAVPAVECTCGYYAFKAIGDAVAYLLDNAEEVWEVELWGTVIEHERGYRAERMRLIRQLTREPVGVLAEVGQATTGEIRRLCYARDAVMVRAKLKKAARDGLCVEVPTPTPNNRGGHLWVWTGG
jgi:hypothetical protein